MVRKITLSDGKQIPALAFGTGSFGHLGFHEQSVADGVRALEAGFRHLDTAQMYETERAIAESIKQSGLDRDEVFVTTKREYEPSVAPATWHEYLSFRWIPSLHALL